MAQSYPDKGLELKPRPFSSLGLSNPISTSPEVRFAGSSSASPRSDEVRLVGSSLVSPDDANAPFSFPPRSKAPPVVTQCPPFAEIVAQKSSEAVHVPMFVSVVGWKTPPTRDFLWQGFLKPSSFAVVHPQPSSIVMGFPVDLSPPAADRGGSIKPTSLVQKWPAGFGSSS